ncbi:hypothetical protein TH53_23770 [Pedobacter lusitanus]|uniref:ABC transporter permease n=1 Tax=Pedobacter lusitanus TaxID=1503925 RepID=A0A0D0EZW1_9SPHI|nr:FtsX-like permease family protein [Pedobacter lusitanus]KIO74903.1 hypothetical protein TH53_23770 [Pedobacter lusitanus]
MLKNYIKIAIKVLLRRKFFTFVSLFGISITLLFVTILVARLDLTISPKAPENNLDKVLIVDRLFVFKNDKREIVKPSYYFLKTYVKKLESPQKVSFYSNNTIKSFSKNKKIFHEVKFTDGEYWKILDFKFLEGKAFNEKDIDEENKVVVINQTTKKHFFGNENAVGKEIEVKGVLYKVSGVVEDVSMDSERAFADIWVPLTSDKNNISKTSLDGNYNAILLASSSDDFGKIKDEFQKSISHVQFPEPDRYDRLSSSPESVIEIFGRIWNKYEPSTIKTVFFILILMFLFMLLPTFNLVNINISRIKERASEIGVRRAFGASSYTLVIQFLVENMLVTFVGGIIGFILSIIVLPMISGYLINSYPGHETIGAVTINLRIFFYSIGLCIFFALISGVYPAYKMSRINIIQALKGNKL